MSLTIYYGSKIETLAEKLKKFLLADRRDADPFEYTRIVVPNPNMAKWLQIKKFATEPCLCAGIEFPFMEKLLTELMTAGLPKDVELLPDHAYAKAIVAVLLATPGEQEEFDKLAPFRSYIMNTDSAADPVAISEQKQSAMTWQLAEKLADLMDDYEVHRPEIVEWWLGAGPCPCNNLLKGEASEAEAVLARALWGENGMFKLSGNRLSLRQLYNRVKDATPAGKPQKIYFFGQSTLSLLQTQIMAWLARTHEVVVFHYNPCREYWGDITTKKEDRKALCGPNINDFDAENELLKSLGIAGRETMQMLVDIEDGTGSEVDPAKRIEFKWDPADGEEPTAETVLEKMQDAVRRRTGEIARCRQDASVQVIGAPGVRREVEMVYNSILGSVASPKGVTGKPPWPPCSFSDIAVIVPDMQAYRPAIEAVFEARGEVPYGLLDTTASEDSHYLQGFLSLIELGRRGLNRERLFNVLENPCVQRAMGFEREDVVGWRELTGKIGAFDGFEHDDQKGYFDWSSALKRLRLARVANKVCEGGEEIPLVKAGGDGALKFSEVVELLHRDLVDTLFDEAGKPRALPLVAARREDGSRGDCWAERLARLAKTYLALEKDDKLETKVCSSLLGTLYSLGDIPHKQSFELAVAAVEHFVGGIPCRHGGYLTSGVTIGGFASLATLPFKQVYMIGMGAGGFPGRTSSSTLDIRGTGWRLGDVSAPNRNRFLFLESIMSVSDRLVFSYPNRDIEKDAEMFPSGIVREVERFIGERVLEYDERTKDEDRRFQEFKGYPLLERGETGPRKEGEKRPTDDIVWMPDDPFAGLLPTYSKAARELARACADGNGKKPEVKAVDPGKTSPRVEISAKVLAEFLKNPVRAVMRHRFGISVAGRLETDLETDSPLGSLDGPDKWNLQEKWLGRDAEKAVDEEIRRLQLSGKMPTGFLGEFAKLGIKEDAKARLARIQEFVKDFALSDGEDNTLHLDFPAELEIEEPENGKGGSGRLKVRLHAEIPNWKVTGDEVSVLVTGRLDDKASSGKGPARIQALPGECCLGPFIACLMHVTQTSGESQELRIGVVDPDSGNAGSWKWKIGKTTAAEYLTSLVRSYLKYEKGGNGGKMIDFTCKNLLKALNEVKQQNAWEEIHEKMTSGESDSPSRFFDNDLVLEKNLERFTREPTQEELKDIFESRYRLPLGGIRQAGTVGEVCHD